MLWLLHLKAFQWKVALTSESIIDLSTVTAGTLGRAWQKDQLTFVFPSQRSVHISVWTKVVAQVDMIRTLQLKPDSTIQTEGWRTGVFGLNVVKFRPNQVFLDEGCKMGQKTEVLLYFETNVQSWLLDMTACIMCPISMMRVESFLFHKSSDETWPGFLVTLCCEMCFESHKDGWNHKQSQHHFNPWWVSILVNLTLRINRNNNEPASCCRIAGPKSLL